LCPAWRSQAREARPEDTARQPRALPDIKSRAFGWLHYASCSSRSQVSSIAFRERIRSDQRRQFVAV